MKLGIFSREDLEFSSWWIRLAAKIAGYRIMYLETDIEKDYKRSIEPIIWGFQYILLCIFLELFCFILFLKCRFSHMMRLGRMTVKTHYSLLHFSNPVLLHLG